MTMEKLFFAIFVIQFPFGKLNSFRELKNIYAIADNREMSCGLHFEMLHWGRSEGRKTTDTKRLKIRNWMKLCELKSLYHIDGGGKVIFGYIQYSAFILE